MDGRIQIDRFAVSNFRSIRECEVELLPLTFFIGANSSGKTSFVDALLFVSSALKDSLGAAVRSRGAIHSLLHQPIRLPATSRFGVFLSSSEGFQAEFHLELRVENGWAVSVSREECKIQGPNGEHYNYLVKDGSVSGSAAVFPAVSVDRIFLANASGLPEFRSVFDFLGDFRSTQPQPPYIHSILRGLHHRTGTSPAEQNGLDARFRQLQQTQPDRFEMVQQYLRAIAPPFDRIEIVESNNTLWLRFWDQSQSGAGTSFLTSQASAGLVNSAEILLELFELPSEGKTPPPVIVEEPEAFLHPGALQALRDSFVEASRTRQVLVTTHSPELLDDPSIPPEWIRVVSRDDDGTHIGMVDAATKSVIRDHLYTAGQLLRQGGLVSKP